MQATITPTRTGFDLTARLADGWRALCSAAAERVHAWHEGHERRQTERALRQLSPYVLHDLGVDASDIASIAAFSGTHADDTRRWSAHC